MDAEKRNEALAGQRQLNATPIVTKLEPVQQQ
jgi:hypothetical protein